MFNHFQQLFSQQAHKMNPTKKGCPFRDSLHIAELPPAFPNQPLPADGNDKTYRSADRGEENRLQDIPQVNTRDDTEQGAAGSTGACTGIKMLPVHHSRSFLTLTWLTPLITVPATVR